MDKRMRQLTDYGVMALFTVLVLITAWHHEPWADEAQAWLLVQDTGLWDLLAHWLRYEGHPSLWYLLLAVPVKLGLPYRWLPFVPAVFAVAGTVVFVRRAPFPAPIRLLAPFGYFTMYQYGVIARAYALFPLLLWLIAADYRHRGDRPWRYIGWLVLLAHTALHGTIIATVLVLDRVREVLAEPGPVGTRVRARMLAPSGVFFLSLAVLALQLRWPRDIVYTGGTISRDPVLILALALTGVAALSLVVFTWSLIWMDRTRVLFLYVCLMSGLLILTSQVYKIWHEGIFFLLWLFLLWIGWDRFRETGVVNRWLKRVGMVALGIVVIVHGYWTGEAIRYDWQFPYSGSRACARYLKEQAFGNRDLFLVGYGGISVLPYFDGNPFSNYNEGTPYRFWMWSMKNPMVSIHMNHSAERYLAWISREQPEWILVSLEREWLADLQGRILRKMPYRTVGTFFGEPRWKGIRFETETLVLMRRVTQP